MKEGWLSKIGGGEAYAAWKRPQPLCYYNGPILILEVSCFARPQKSFLNICDDVVIYVSWILFIYISRYAQHSGGI